MHSIRISTVALLAALVVSTPTLAASIRLLDSDNPVKVNLNDGDGVKANVNLGNTKVKANVDAGDVLGNNDGDNTPVSVSIGNTKSGSKPATVTVTGSPLSSGTTKVKVNTGTQLPDTTGGLINDGTTKGTVTLGGSQDNLADDLFGGTTNAKANLSIGNTIPLGGTDIGGLSTADAAINASPVSGLTDPMGGLGDVANVVASVNLLQDLFGGTIGGGGTGGGTGGTGGGTGGTGGGTGGTGGGIGGTGDGTGGSIGGTGDAGGTGGGIGSGGGGSGGGNGGIGGNGGSGIGGSGGLVASVDGNVGARCFTPNSQQSNTLINRHGYSPTELSAYSKANSVQVVRIELCPSARRMLAAKAAADGDVHDLQTFIARSAALTGGLSQSGKGPTDVVGADRKGSVLVVYVI